MRWKLWLATAGLLMSAAAAADTQTAFKDVPRDHWAYAAMQGVERSGVFTGYPGQTFTGKRLLTRYEFAVAVQRSSQLTGHPATSGGPTGSGALRLQVLRKLGLSQVTIPEGLPRLVAEFTPELKLLGADVDQLSRNLKAVESRAEAPEPLADGLKHSRSYEEGRREADAEWKKGVVTFYTAGLMGTPVVDKQLGIPLNAIAGCIVTQTIIDQMAGHNDQVHRLILQHGLPVNAKREWLPQILEPVKYWRSLDRAPQALRFDRKEVASPDGALRLRLKHAPVGEMPKLLAAKNGEPFGVNLFQVDRAHPQVEVQWGPEKSELLFVRYVTTGVGAGEAYAALDTRTGRLLNVAYVPVAKGP